MAEDPIDTQVLLLAAAKASVPGTTLPDLVTRVQSHLGAKLEDYHDRYECVHENDVAVFFVPEGHWRDLRSAVDMERREIDAVRRAHREQLRRIGRNTGRADEFETALDIREVVIIAG